MADLSRFDPNAAGNPNNNIFGLPFSEEDAQLVLLPVPWEVTVSYGAGTARSAEHICKASLQVDLFDTQAPDAWKKGFYMRDVNKKILLKSDYLRKEAELYIDYISKGDLVEKNKFMCKSLREINEGGKLLNNWVYEQTTDLLKQGKLVGLIGGDHSTPLGYFKAQAEKHGQFGILQIDAHCDLRRSYNDFTYSHASVMYNALGEIPEIQKLVQVGVRDLCEEEWAYINNSNSRVITYFDQQLKERLFEGETWKQLVNEMIQHLPQKVHISFDIDGLDPKLCPHTGTPVQGGFEAEQVLYLFNKIVESGRTLIGFDLVEVGVGEYDWDSNVGAHLLWRMSNLLIKSNMHD
ncbi:agmatinase family protein [Deminuibacter soli]|uniref:Agmatinase n=1 Tax=Deminuibacter soli TaxID=2291815 RepID=A0A3E1NJ86_9BACT|nr:agmatinase family protein [Deminuibacter soli]RFM27983.1 agmatinase [Deminuibacter soli]